MSSLTKRAADTLLTPAPAATEAEENTAVEQELDVLDDEYYLLKMSLPPGVNIRDAIEYGFYEHKNRWWVRRAGDRFEPVSNFTLRVLFLIQGANPKRIVEIRNVFGRTATLDFSIEDLISLEKFKGRVESAGNFIFEGKPTDLTKIKTKLYNEEKASLEIARLGQYKAKFFAFANGIYNGTAWLDIDDRGMVDVDGEHYYIPVFGSTKADDDEDLRNYRKFLHRPSAVTFSEWADLFCQVYGENGQVGIAFFFFSLFSDIIFDKTKAAPMLFLFGQRGSGKGTMAQSLLTLFGYPQDPLMLGGASTVVGFMRKLGQFNNAIVWLDEYKNDIGEKKIESLKNIWDRVGYERGVKDSSNRTQSTPVTSTAIISGQEIPNVEPALFSRTVLCEFRAMQRSEQAVRNFNLLRKMEDGGITNAALEILTHRESIAQNFQRDYTEIATALRSAFQEDDVIERQIVNYAILVTCCKIMQEHIRMPFTWTHLLQVSERYIKRQRDMMSTANEVQQFFEMVAFLLSNNLIKYGRDIYCNKGLVMLRTITIIPLYREYSRRQGTKALDRGTLMNYMQNSPAYCENESKQSSHRFPDLQNPTSAQVFLHGEMLKLYGIDFGEITQDPENQQQPQQENPEDPF
jgi:hypothetical protein